MEKKFSKVVPNDFLDCLPVFIFFVKGIENVPRVNKDLSYACSIFYNTKKMKCYEFYKPFIL